VCAEERAGRRKRRASVARTAVAAAQCSSCCNSDEHGSKHGSLCTRSSKQQLVFRPCASMLQQSRGAVGQYWSHSVQTQLGECSDTLRQHAQQQSAGQLLSSSCFGQLRLNSWSCSLAVSLPATALKHLLETTWPGSNFSCCRWVCSMQLCWHRIAHSAACI
jgi:hypothetical protein